MKEEEAKTKWCPMFRVGFNPEFQHNRIHDGKCGNCLASDCMMWKWDIKLNRELAGGGQPEDAENIGYEGYCGLIKEG